MKYSLPCRSGRGRICKGSMSHAMPRRRTECVTVSQRRDGLRILRGAYNASPGARKKDGLPKSLPRGSESPVRWRGRNCPEAPAQGAGSGPDRARGYSPSRDHGVKRCGNGSLVG